MSLIQGVFPAALNDSYADELTKPFWDGALEGQLRGQQCTSCSAVLIPPAPYCFVCQGKDFKWIDLPGTGTIFTFTVVRHPLNPALKEVVPYLSAVVDIDGTQGAGARMLLNVTDCDVEAVQIGDKVQIYFEPRSETYAVPRARPLT